ncbi:MAG: hypothetical protein M0T78_01805 [Actinomycetota bacterium]|jgi:hypothetical protein|nr:hypothetical protein [Actinomycetota bacterium]
MSQSNAELSSIQSILEELNQRIKAIADQALKDPSDMSTPHLLALERSLSSAIRSIVKAQRS